MAPPSEQTGEWYSIVGSSIGITLVAILAFIASYFKKAASEPESPAGSVAAKAVGAAFVDNTTQAAILRMDTNLDALTKLAQNREKRENDDMIAERAAEKAAERAAEEVERRLAKNRKD